MEREKLKLANEIEYKISRREKQLSQLLQTKEFTKISMSGENGAEKQCHFNFDSDKDIVELIKKNIEDFLRSEIKIGLEQLKEI